MYARRPRLTGRGKLLLLLSFVIFVAATIVGEGDLVRVAVLVLLTPLVCWLWLLAQRPKLRVERTLDPVRIGAGQKCNVRLSVTNVSTSATSTAMLEDRIPYTLGDRPRLLLEKLSSDARTIVTYGLAPQFRGKYQIGPLRAYATDPFGMTSVQQEFSTVSELVVTPRIHPLESIKMGGPSGTVVGESRALSVAISGEDDVAAREYRYGDDLRRIHWPTTAHRGELMVRREEQPWDSTATLLLDIRKTAHFGDGPDSSFEWDVEAAASICRRLAADGMSSYLVTAWDDIASRTEEFAHILTFLATIQPTTKAEVPQLVTRARTHRNSSAVIALLGHVTPEQAAQLSELGRQRQHIGIIADPVAWGGLSGNMAQKLQEEHHEATRLLQGAGWLIRSVKPTTKLSHLWSGVSRAEAKVGS